MSYFEVSHNGRPIALQAANTVREAICLVAGCRDDELKRVRQCTYCVPDGRTLQVDEDGLMDVDGLFKPTTDGHRICTSAV